MTSSDPLRRCTHVQTQTSNPSPLKQQCSTCWPHKPNEWYGTGSEPPCATRTQRTGIAPLCAGLDTGTPCWHRQTFRPVGTLQARWHISGPDLVCGPGVEHPCSKMFALTFGGSLYWADLQAKIWTCALLRKFSSIQAFDCSYRDCQIHHFRTNSFDWNSL